MRTRFFLALGAGAMALAVGLVPGAVGSPAGAASRTDGALTFALSGSTSVGLQPTNNLFYTANSSGDGALTALSDVSAVSCRGYEDGSGSLLGAGANLEVSCANKTTTIACDLTATRTYVTSVIAYGPCIVKQGTSTWNIFVPATVLKWVPTGTSSSSTSFVLSGTLPLVDV